MDELREKLGNIKCLIQGQGYGWTMKKKKMRCHSLQMRLRQSMYAISRKEPIAFECEMEVHYCEPKQGPIRGEDDSDEYDKKRHVGSLTNCLQENGIIIY